jgi:hypothetical protein
MAAVAVPAPVQAPVQPMAATRERLREAIVALSKSEAFLDVLASELASAGLWR